MDGTRYSEVKVIQVMNDINLHMQETKIQINTMCYQNC